MIESRGSPFCTPEEEVSGYRKPASTFLNGWFNQQKGVTGLGGFEPPTSGLEARRYVQAKPQAHCASNIRVEG